MIGILDYGSGNVRAIANVLRSLDVSFAFVKSPSEIRKSDGLILPGVGAFDEVMEKLNGSGMRPELEAAVLENGKPILGICVGMQVMAQRSEEGTMQGLGWFDATVKRFDESMFTESPKLPHMGWNSVEPARASPLWEDVDLSQGFYFVHSYYFDCTESRDVFSRSTYGIPFSSAVSKGNIFGFQFHPEKSHRNGLQLFLNFARYSAC